MKNNLDFKKKSCVDALIEFTEFIREGWDKKLFGQSCLVDLKKAFDTINDDLLLAKLGKKRLYRPDFLSSEKLLYKPVSICSN